MTDQFEARLVGYKKESRKDGDWVEVRFHIHPDDVTPAINNSPLKTRFMVVAVPFEEGPVNEPVTDQNSAAQELAAVQEPIKPRHGTPKRTWDEIPPAQQSGIRCNDEEFAIWLIHRWPQQVGMDGIVGFVRNYCNIQSRAELATNPGAAEKWRKLDQQFMARHMAEER